MSDIGYELADVCSCKWCGNIHQGGPGVCDSPITMARATRKYPGKWSLTLFLNRQMAGTLIVDEKELNWFLGLAQKTEVEP